MGGGTQKDRFRAGSEEEEGPGTSEPNDEALSAKQQHDQQKETLDMLNSSFANMITMQETAMYHPITPVSYTRTGELPFPKAPCLGSEAFERFDLDTLFFVFYFQHGTEEQMLAARELRRHQWQYHQKYRTWFQKVEDEEVSDPQHPDRGTWKYFDHQRDWCTNVTRDFSF